MWWIRFIVVLFSFNYKVHSNHITKTSIHDTITTTFCSCINSQTFVWTELLVYLVGPLVNVSALNLFAVQITHWTYKPIYKYGDSIKITLRALVGVKTRGSWNKWSSVALSRFCSIRTRTIWVSCAITGIGC